MGLRGNPLDFNQQLEISIDVAHGMTYPHQYAVIFSLWANSPRANGGLSYTSCIFRSIEEWSLLHSSKNILASSTSLECEEALNNGSMSAADGFVSLKTKSVLHLFARICRFLGLQVYEQGFSAVKLPKNILSGSTVLVMGFPDCGSSYYLLMQLDEDLVKICWNQAPNCSSGIELRNVTKILETFFGPPHLACSPLQAPSK
ncbi:hypothetical protein OROMI_001226 [Orobanche minor]